VSYIALGQAQVLIKRVRFHLALSIDDYYHDTFFTSDGDTWVAKEQVFMLLYSINPNCQRSTS